MAEVKDPAVIDEALGTLRQMLANDDYHVKWEATGADTLQVTIEAGPDACADCLAPQPVIESIMSNALKSTPYSIEKVVLPEVS